MRETVISLLCMLVCCLLAASDLRAQSPEAFKYQAVVRNPNNTPVVD
ncbi:MAG: hypothetical protein AAFZ52_07790 [Bacteroidota bacterium]